MRRLRSYGFVFVLFVLAACGGSGDGGENANGNSEASLVRWDRSPSHVVFRAEVVGGDESEFYRRSEVPLCTIYGDNRLVWTNQVDVGIEVLFDTLSDEEISSFVQGLVLEQEIYDLAAEADFQVATGDNPVYEQITISVNDETHVTDSFSDWGVDYFEGIIDLCTGLADTPTIFQPDGAWITVQQVDANPARPTVRWYNEASGLDITALANSGEREWITGRNLLVLWELITESTPDLLFSEQEGVYQIALQVPNVSKDAPPAPEA